MLKSLFTVATFVLFTTLLVLVVLYIVRTVTCWYNEFSGCRNRESEPKIPRGIQGR